MVRIMKPLLAAWSLIVLSGATFAADLKVATVDLNRLLNEYYRSQDVAKELDAKHKALFDSIAELRLDGERLAKEANDLRQGALDPALKEAARTDKLKSLERKLGDVHAFELKYDQTRAEKETEFQLQVGQAKKTILNEVLTATRGIGEKEGFNLVLDASRSGPPTDVVFAKNVTDLTDMVLASLNATRAQPKQTNTPPPKRQP